MVTNSAVTVYSRQYDSEKRLDIWERTYVKDAWWNEAESSAITSEGLCDIDMATAKDLKGTECCKVTSANYNTFGANPHIKVGGV